MTYVEGRLASPRAKRMALGILSLGVALSFGASVARNLGVEDPEPAGPAPGFSDVPEAVAYAGPLTPEIFQETVRPAPRRAAKPPSPTLQAEVAPAVTTAAVEAAAIAPVMPVGPLRPPPSIATAKDVQNQP